MTQSEFIQKFCPDFEAKQQQREVLKRSIITPGNFEDKIAFIGASRSLSDEMFYEACFLYGLSWIFLQYQY